MDVIELSLCFEEVDPFLSRNIPEPSEHVLSQLALKRILAYFVLNQT